MPQQNLVQNFKLLVEIVEKLDKALVNELLMVHGYEKVVQERDHELNRRLKWFSQDPSPSTCLNLKRINNKRNRLNVYIFYSEFFGLNKFDSNLMPFT